jgi:hypothetical protein
MADNLPPSSADVTESGSLNLPRTLWASQACNGITLPFIKYFWVTKSRRMRYAEHLVRVGKMRNVRTGLVVETYRKGPLGRISYKWDL